LSQRSQIRDQPTAAASENALGGDPTAVAASQASTVEALASGSAIPGGSVPRRIDTHMSHLFLADGHAYKLTRSRVHPFADMSTVMARRRACEEELIANAAWAPGLYEAVLPVVLDPQGGIAIGGSGSVVDWILKLRRFDDGALLAEMADAGRLTPELVVRTAQRVAECHAALPRRRDAGHAVDYRRIIVGLRATDAAGAEALGVRSTAGPFFDALEHELARRAPLIEARRRAGAVARGHGDLHLGNICLFRGEVTPFDALGFDARLATADVLYDIAFLLMDLRARGLDDLANVAMNRYWDASSTPEGALALFMALRAAVRMAVAVEAGDLAAAARYCRLGHDLLQPIRPRVVAIGGLSGTGKSTIAQALAPTLPGVCGARMLRTDVLRKLAAGAEVSTAMPETAYTPAARAAVYRALAERAAAAVAADASVVADATFREPSARAEIERAAARGAFQGVWLRTTAAVRIARVAARRGDASDATPAVAQAQTEPTDLSASWRVVDAGRCVAEVEAEVRAIVLAGRLAHTAPSPPV
jgi:aminoglycoside phosphotransferase family enzyme/predicted kinase